MPRLVADLWVDAEIRSAISQGLMAYRLHKGDKERGSVMIKVMDMRGGAYILQQSMDFDGNRAWARRPHDDSVMSDPEADDKIRKSRANDPDLWVIEIEDPAGSYELREPINKDL